MTGFDMVLALCMLFVGVYMLVCGIRCKGMVFENDNFDYGSDYFQKYCRVVRTWCFVIFALLMITFVFSTLAYFKHFTMNTPDFLTRYSVAEQDGISAAHSLYSYIGFYSRFAALGAIVLMIINSTLMGQRAQRLNEKKTTESVRAQLREMTDDTNNNNSEEK